MKNIKSTVKISTDVSDESKSSFPSVKNEEILALTN